MISSFWQSRSAGINDNMRGDGTLLGSSLVIGPGDQGILFQHCSREFGDRAKNQDILRAAERLPTTKDNFCDYPRQKSTMIVFVIIFVAIY